MKRFTVFSILVVFLFLLGGQFVAYYSCLTENREVMKESILEGKLNTSILVISIDNSQEEACIDGNELNWNGHRYDIVSIEHKTKKTIIHAINDATEERLLAGLNENYTGISHQSPLHHRSAQVLADFFKEYLFPGRLISPMISGSESSYFLQLNIFVQDGFKNYCVPPPKNQVA